MESASFRAAPVFKIDLSLPPHERWVAVSKVFCELREFFPKGRGGHGRRYLVMCEDVDAYRGVLPGLVKEIWAMLGVSKKEIKELCS
eukprot:1350758-Amorphochlora_amoeboformis.AAC.2